MSSAMDGNIESILPVGFPIRGLLDQIYNLHLHEILVQKNRADKLVEDLRNLEDEKKKLQEENAKVNVRLEKIEDENKRLTERLREPCKECPYFREQVKYLKRMCNDMYKNTHLGGERKRFGAENLNNELFTEAPDEDSLNETGEKGGLERVKPVNDQTKYKEDTEKEHRSPDQAPNQKAQESDEPWKTKDTSPKSPRRILSLPKSNKRSRFSEEIPVGKKQRLSPSDDAKNKRETNTNKAVQASSHSRRFQLETQETKVNPVIIVPDTCDYSTEEAANDRQSSTSRARKTGRGSDEIHFLEPSKPASKKMNRDLSKQTVVPETEPIESEQVSGDEERSIKERGDEFSSPPNQNTMRCLDISLPSHSSTPLCSEGRSKIVSAKFNVTPLDDSEDDGDSRDSFTFDKKESVHSPDNCDIVADSQESRDGYEEDTGMTSPVFGRNPNFHSKYQDATNSPSLFDEPDSPIKSQQEDLSVSADNNRPKFTNKNKTPVHLVLRRNILAECDGEIDISTQSKPSPSLVSGAIPRPRPVDKPPEDGWLSSASAKRLSDSHAKNRHSELHPSPSSQNALKFVSKSKESTKIKVFQTATSQEDMDLDISSPHMRVTRSQRQKSSQEDKNVHSKSMRQTTLSQAFVFPQTTTRLSDRDTYNGGKLGRREKEKRPMTAEEKEAEDVNKAIEESLKGFAELKQSSVYFTAPDDYMPEMSEPQCTSTPLPPARKISSSDSDSSFLFKRPAPKLIIDKAGPPVPKNHGNINEVSQRKQSTIGNDFIDESSKGASTEPKYDHGFDSVNTNSVSLIRTEGANTGFRYRKGAHMIPESVGNDTTTDESLQLNTEVRRGNASLGPGVRLSEFEDDDGEDSSKDEPLPEFKEYQESVSFLSLCVEEERIKGNDRVQDSPIAMRDEEGESMTEEPVVFRERNAASASGKGEAIKRPAAPHASSHNAEREHTHGACVRQDKDDDGSSEELDLEDMDDDHDTSFDRVRKHEQPKYAYVDVVRKKAEREQLDAFACPSCKSYYATENLTAEERRARMKSCRHKARYVPPSTPEHFWSIGMPDTQECEERGYFHTTQHKPSRFRRKKGLNFFKLDKEDQESQD